MVSSAQIPTEFLVSWKPLHPPGNKDRTRSTPATSDDTATSTSTDMSSTTSQSSSSKKFRSACDLCRQSRVKCSGGATCHRCKTNRLQCSYGISLRSGRVKASRANEKIQSESSSNRVKRVRRNEDVSRLGRSESPEITLELNRANGDNIFAGLTAGDGQDEFAFNDLDCFENINPILKDFTFGYSTAPSFDSSLNPPQPFSVTPEGGVMSTQNLDFQPDFQSFQNNLEDPKDSTTQSKNSPENPYNPLITFNLSSKSSCRCLSTQMYCVAELCDMHEDICSRPLLHLGLDSILQMSREKTKHVSSYLSCKLCSKNSANFIFPTIISQRLTQIFCSVARNPSFYLQSMKLRVGAFELSEEDDVLHKKMLISSAVKQIDFALGELGDTAKDYERKMLATMTTESGKSNLEWVFDSVRILKRRVILINELLESPHWGLK